MIKIKGRLKNLNNWSTIEFTPQNSNVYDANAITEKVFSNTNLKEIFPQKPFATEWYCYDLFYNQIAHTSIQLDSLLKSIHHFDKIIFIECESKYKKYLNLYFHFYKIPHKFTQKKSIIFSQIINFFLQIFLVFFSVLSIIFFYLKNDQKVGLWTGDYTDSNGGFDPRLGDLRKKINITIVEFIRYSSIGPLTCLKNFLKRKRSVIYYTSFKYFLLFIPPRKSLVRTTDFHLFCVSSFLHEIETELKLVKFWQYIFKKIKINNFIVWFFSHRTAGLLWACKKNNINTIGIMHGLTTPYHMGHEYLPSFKDFPYGPDKFGVWNEFWRSKYQSISKFYPKDSIQISGALRPNKKIILKNIRQKSSVTNVLFISEQSVPPEQIYPFYESIISDNNIKIYLKVRNFGVDSYFKKFQEERPDLLKKISILNIDLIDAMKLADVVIGSHSTAVLEAALYSIPFIFIYTPMWQDYFEMDLLNKKLSPPYPTFIHRPTQLKNAIKLAKQDSDQSDIFLNEIKTIFFGDQNISGTDWISKQLIF